MEDTYMYLIGCLNKISKMKILKVNFYKIVKNSKIMLINKYTYSLLLIN